MFKRIRNIIKMSEAPKEAIDEAVKVMKDNSEKLGDGKAVFISEGTEQDYKDMENEKKGLKGIFGL